MQATAPIDAVRSDPVRHETSAARAIDVRLAGYQADHLLQAVSSGVIVLDSALRVVFSNAAALRFVPKRMHDILGISGKRIWPGRNGWVVDRARRVAATGVADVTRNGALSFPGQRLVVTVTVLPLTTGRTGDGGTMLVFDDMTVETRATTAISRLVDPRLAGPLIEHDGEALSGRRVRATVMFCDLRNSTALAETLGPEATVALLNGYYGLVDDCLRCEGGMIDKFIGDAVMATFGVPDPAADDEDRAVRAALAMSAALNRWNRARAARGESAVEMGIGINTDDVVAGTVGSRRRMSYTAIGAGVNLAARLEKACKRFGATILISGQTVRRLEEQYPLRLVGTLPRSGTLDPLDVHELIDDDTVSGFDDLPAALAAFARGVDLRQQGRLDAAAASFRTCLALNPADRGAAIQLDACQQPRSTGHG